jgi:hypothetical protein
MTEHRTAELETRRGSPARLGGIAGMVSAVMAAAIVALGACGSPATEPDSPPSPTPAASATGESPGSPAPEQPADDAPGGGDAGNPDNPDQEGAPQALQIEVTTLPPTASHPCQPSGSILVSGGDGGDSTVVGEGPEYPLDVTYQWFIRKTGPDPQAAVPYGQPATLQFTVAGGIPVSAPALTPVPDIEVELRVVEPETIAGGWVAHPGCS